MATMSVPSAAVQAKKVALLAQQGEWRIVRDPKTGQRVIVMPNYDGTRVYYVEPTGRACSCQAGQNGLLCSHRLAAIERANHEALATWLTDVRPAPLMADLYTRCARVGCSELTEGTRLCDEDAALAERSQRLAAARARVAMKI